MNKITHRPSRRGFAGGVAGLGLVGLSGAARAQAPVAPLDDSGRVIPAPRPNPYPYSGVSGPGLPATEASARGGWMSGLVGVRYEGERPMKYPTLPWDGAATGSAVARGLIPPIKPMMELHIRDTQICVGGDGRYYMTGSTGDNIWAFNDGVELWRSDDLKSWDYLGLVWSIERDGGWEKNWRMRKGVPFRALWAPEIHYVGGTYAIVHSMSRAGLAILKSVSGKPEGPYRHAFSPDAPLRKGIDATLFQDDDGSVWFTYGSAEEIVRLKDDLSGYAEEWRPTRFVTPELNPARHRDTCRAKGMLDLGFEGATLFKRDGVYYLGAVDFYEGRYSFCLATSDKLDGPYRGRHEAVPCGGGGNFFRDASGQWWCTFFGNDEQSPFREKPAIVAVDFDSAGRVMVATQQP